MRTACASEPAPPSQRQRWGKPHGWILRKIGPLSIPTEILCGSNEQPGQGHSLTGKHKLLSIVPAFFSTKKYCVLIFKQLEGKDEQKLLLRDNRYQHFRLLPLQLRLPQSGTFRSLLLVVRPSLGMS